MFVSMKNNTGLVRKVKFGFSWTALFFGGFPFFFRGMPVQGAIWIVLALFTAGISNLFLCFMINKLTAQHYLEIGYRPVGKGWNVAGPQWNIQALPLTPSTTSTNTERSCPWCAETILVAAKICKHCGKEVEPQASDQAEKLRAKLEALAQARNNS